MSHTPQDHHSEVTEVADNTTSQHEHQLEHPQSSTENATSAPETQSVHANKDQAALHGIHDVAATSHSITRDVPEDHIHNDQAHISQDSLPTDAMVPHDVDMRAHPHGGEDSVVETHSHSQADSSIQGDFNPASFAVHGTLIPHDVEMGGSIHGTQDTVDCHGSDARDEHRSVGEVDHTQAHFKDQGQGLDTKSGNAQGDATSNSPTLRNEDKVNEHLRGSDTTAMLSPKAAHETVEVVGLNHALQDVDTGADQKDETQDSISPVGAEMTVREASDFVAKSISLPPPGQQQQVTEKTLKEASSIPASDLWSNTPASFEQPEITELRGEPVSGSESTTSSSSSSSSESDGSPVTPWTARRFVRAGAPSPPNRPFEYTQSPTPLAAAGDVFMTDEDEVAFMLSRETLNSDTPSSKVSPSMTASAPVDSSGAGVVVDVAKDAQSTESPLGDTMNLAVEDTGVAENEPPVAKSPAPSTPLTVTGVLFGDSPHKDLSIAIQQPDSTRPFLDHPTAVSTPGQVDARLGYHDNLDRGDLSRGRSVSDIGATTSKSLMELDKELALLASNTKNKVPDTFDQHDNPAKTEHAVMTMGHEDQKDQQKRGQCETILEMEGGLKSTVTGATHTVTTESLKPAAHSGDQDADAENTNSDQSSGNGTTSLGVMGTAPISKSPLAEEIVEKVEQSSVTQGAGAAADSEEPRRPSLIYPPLEIVAYADLNALHEGMKGQATSDPTTESSTGVVGLQSDVKLAHQHCEGSLFGPKEPLEDLDMPKLYTDFANAGSSEHQATIGVSLAPQSPDEGLHCRSPLWTTATPPGAPMPVPRELPAISLPAADWSLTPAPQGAAATTGRTRTHVPDMSISTETSPVESRPPSAVDDVEIDPSCDTVQLSAGLLEDWSPTHYRAASSPAAMPMTLPMGMYSSPPSHLSAASVCSSRGDSAVYSDHQDDADAVSLQSQGSALVFKEIGPGVRNEEDAVVQSAPQSAPGEQLAEDEPRTETDQQLSKIPGEATVEHPGDTPVVVPQDLPLTERPVSVRTTDAVEPGSDVISIESNESTPSPTPSRRGVMLPIPHMDVHPAGHSPVLSPQISILEERIVELGMTEALATPIDGEDRFFGHDADGERNGTRDAVHGTTHDAVHGTTHGAVHDTTHDTVEHKYFAAVDETGSTTYPCDTKASSATYSNELAGVGHSGEPTVIYSGKTTMNANDSPQYGSTARAVSGFATSAVVEPVSMAQDVSEAGGESETTSSATVVSTPLSVTVSTGGPVRTNSELSLRAEGSQSLLEGYGSVNSETGGTAAVAWAAARRERRQRKIKKLLLVGTIPLIGAVWFAAAHAKVVPAVKAMLVGA